MKSKEEYIKKMSKQLKEWSAKIDELESKIGSGSADMKASYQERLVDMREKRDALSRKLQELKSSSGEAWKTLTAGMDGAWATFKDAFQSAVNKFKKAA